MNTFLLDEAQALFLDVLLSKIREFLFSGIVNSFLDKAEELLSNVILFLPTSPFRAYMDSFSNFPYLSAINYFIPINVLIGITETWVTAIGLYYFYSVVLRWAKAIQ